MSAKNIPKSPIIDERCPEQWREVTLSSVAEIRFSAVNKIPEPGEDPVRLCNYIDVYNNDYITADMEFMYATATRTEIERFGLQVGDVIITKDSETPDDIGVPAIVDSTAPDLVCGYHLALIRLKTKEVDSTFLAKQLGHHRIARYFGQQANGSTRYGLSTASIANTLLRLPPPEHQAATSRILRLVDEAIGKTEQVIAKLKQVRAGLLHDLLTRGLDEHGQLRDPLAHPEQFQDSPIGRIPKAWKPATVGDVVSRDRQGILTGPFGADLGTADFVAQGVPVLQVGNVQSGFFDLSDVKFVTDAKANELGRYRVNAGDLLFARSGATTGRNALANDNVAGAIINYHIIRVAVDRTACHPSFLFACFNSERLQRQIHSEKGKGTREGINTTAISGFQFALPLLEEQTAIVASLQAVDDSITQEVTQREKLVVLKSGLMTDLLTGRVPVPADLLGETT